MKHTHTNPRHRFEQQLMDKLHKKQDRAFYQQYVRQQYGASDDVFAFDTDHPLYDTISEKVIEQLRLRAGYVYVALNPSNGWYKVGMTQTLPQQRIKALNQAGVCDDLQLIKAYPVLDVALQKDMHQALKTLTHYHKKEFFKLDLDSIEQVIVEEKQRFRAFLNEILNIWV